MIASLLAIYLLLTWVRSTHLFATNRNTFEIEFTDVNGVKAGDPVTIFGHPSGNVTGIRLGENGAIVTIGLDRNVVLHQDVRAEILVKELMGGKLIEIKPGRKGPPLADGSRFLGETSLDFSTAFSRFGNFLDRIGEERIDSLITNINNLASIYASIGRQIDNQDIGGLFKDLSNGAGSLNRMLAQMEQRHLVSKIDSAMAQLTKLGKKADQALSSVTALSDKVQASTLPKADHLMDELLVTLDQTEEVITGVRDLLTQLKDTRTTAGRLIYDPELNKELDFTIDNFNKTLDHLRTKKVMITFTLSKKNTGDDPPQK